MTRSTIPVAELRHVVLRYGSGETEIRAVDDVTGAVQPRECLALLGPSGAGKSTLLSLLGLLDRPDVGEVWLSGVRADDQPEEARADLRRMHIGFVFQLFHLIPALSAVHNVAVPLLPYVPRDPLLKRAQELLTDLGLGARLNHLPGQLSGGEQQRVAIARALIADPDLVLADEPTGNLDSRTARQVMDLLLSLQETHGFALVVATHDEAVARQLDRRWSLLDGALMTC